MSLADRKKALEKEEANRNKIEDGTYSVRLKDWKFSKSQKGDDMYTLTWKIIDKGDYKGKERRTFYLPGQSWGLNALLDLIESFGADLETMDDTSEIDDVFERVEDTKMPKAMMTITNEEGKKFPKIEITDVEQVLGLENDEEGEEEEEESAPKAKKSKAKTKAKKEESEEDEVVAP